MLYKISIHIWNAFTQKMKEKKMGTSSNTYLLYHVIFSTKNRAPLLPGQTRKNVFAYMGTLIKDIGGHPILINGIEDHVHILAILPKHIAIMDIIHKIKGASSHWYNQEFGKSLPRLYWQEGYNIYTVSGSELNRVRLYIFNQEDHHRKMDLAQEMLLFEEKLRECYNPAKWDNP